MKKIGSIIFLLVPFQLFAQRAVLVEEFTGAYCAQCPLSALMLDSLSKQYPNVIPLVLHSYTPADAMFTNQVDTIGQAFTMGAPLATINRQDNPAVYHTQWESRIQQMSSMPDLFDLQLQSSFNTVSRKIVATVTAEPNVNLTLGDYRINLYIVEDSVTGTGAGYEQSNAYNTQPGSPFYGKGNPIVGYVFRHVVRHILPSAWGDDATIPLNPLVGQSYSAMYEYTLPQGFDEGQIALVASVWKASANHLADTVLDAKTVKLSSGVLSASMPKIERSFHVYPNPTTDQIRFDGDGGTTLPKVMEVTDMAGRTVSQKTFRNGTVINKSDLGGAGVYIYRIYLNDSKLETGMFTVLLR